MANSNKWKKIEVETSSGKVAGITNYVNSVRIDDLEKKTEFITKPYSQKRVAEIKAGSKVYLFEFNDDDMRAEPVYVSGKGELLLPLKLMVIDIDGNRRVVTGVEKG